MSNYEKVKHSAEKEADNAADLLDEAKGRFSNLADEAKVRGEKLLEKVKERGSDIWDEAQDQGKDLWQDVQSGVRKNPGAAIGCAFIAGVLFYAFLSRREE